jgi:hypothetical protein
MKKGLLGAVCLSGLCLALTACGKTSAAEQQRAERYGLTATTATSSSQKVVHAIAGRAATSSSTTATAQASSYSQHQASLTDSLSDNDWYVLAYLSEWGYSLNQDNTSASPGFELANGCIDQGTVDSQCKLVSVTADSVTVAPSSGEGAYSTYTNKTLAKTMLANKFIHDTNDVSTLQALTNQLVSRGS